MIELGPAGLVVAFAAGLVSFSSPCVLPLVPGYLSFVSGVGFDELGVRPQRVVTSTAAFVAGFTAMFVAFGAGSAWFGNALLANRRPLEIAAGIFVIVAALLLVGLPFPRFSPPSGDCTCAQAVETSPPRRRRGSRSRSRGRRASARPSPRS
jgi:cytochrome c-type biogenesis protein